MKSPKLLDIMMACGIWTTVVSMTTFMTYEGYKNYKKNQIEYPKPPSALDYDFIIKENQYFDLKHFHSKNTKTVENFKDLKTCLNTPNTFCFIKRDQFQNIEEISLDDYKQETKHFKNPIWITIGIDSTIQKVFVSFNDTPTLYEIPASNFKDVSIENYAEHHKIPIYKISKQDDLKTTEKIGGGIAVMLFNALL